jgi:uncharacterized protein YggT (Ycf19 family)
MVGILRMFINIVLTVIEFLLSIRFILKFFNVGSSSQFVSWIYGTSASLVAPFSGIIAPLNIAGFTIDFTTLIALIIYGLVGGIILRLLSYISRGY